MPDINTKVFQEITVATSNPDKVFTKHTSISGPTDINANLRAQPVDSERYKFNPSKTFKYDKWQQDVVDQLNSSLTSRRDMFINVSPAGGKSHPIQEGFWKKRLMAATTKSEIPKILWVCENKTLASEVANAFINIILDVIKDLSDPRKRNPNNYFEKILPPSLRTGYQYSPIQTSGAISTLRRFAESFVALNMQNVNQPITHNTIAATCTYVYAPEIIKTLKPNLVVIDEIQERFKPTSGMNNEKELSDLDDRVRYFIKTFEALPSIGQCNVCLLSGSIAHETSTAISKFLNIQYKRNFLEWKPVSAYNRASVGVVPYDEMSNNGRRDDRAIVSEIVKQVRGGSKNNLIAVFGQNAIEKITRQVMQQLPARSIEVTCGLQRSFRVPKSNPEIRTNNRGSIADLAKEIETNPQALMNHLEAMIKGKVVRGTRCDTFLGNALLHGVGYIMSEKRNAKQQVLRAYNPADVKVVETLLKKGLINSVIATTSVGVGVNLKIRNLYLPSIDIWKGSGSGPMDASSLVQLLNRAGRASGESATIYCASEIFPQVSQYFGKGKFAGDPSKSVPIIPFFDMKEGTGLFNRLIRTMGPVKIMKLMVKLMTNNS